MSPLAWLVFLLSAPAAAAPACEAGPEEDGTTVLPLALFLSSHLGLGTVAFLDPCLEGDDDFLARFADEESSTENFIKIGNQEVSAAREDGTLYVALSEGVARDFLEKGSDYPVLLVGDQEKVLARSSLRLDSMVFLAGSTLGGDPKLEVCEVHSIMGGPQILNKLGEWDSNQEIFHETPLWRQNIWERRCDLRGVTLRALALEYSPMTQPGLDSGFMPDLAGAVASKCNFSISYSEPGDGLWGAATDTAGLVFNGMVGALSRLEADLATGGLYASRDRGRVVDFSVPVFQDTITLHIVRQNGNIINWIVYMVKGTKKKGASLP